MGYLYIVIIILLIINIKWILILVNLPYQALYNRFRAKKYYGNDTLIDRILAIPYYIYEMKLFRAGWERWMIYQIGLFPSHHIRKYIYIILGAKISKEVVFHFKTEIRAPYMLKIGKGTIIGDNVLLDARNKIIVGENVNFSSNVSVYTEQHDHRDPFFRCSSNKEDKRVVVGNRVWIGSNVIILPGVTVGEGAVCCAGSVVTKDVDAYSVVAGVPAKKVNDRPRNLNYCFKENKANRLY